MVRKFTRPGVQAAVDLARDTENESLWNQVVGRYEDMLREKGGGELVQLNQFCENDLFSHGAYLSKDDLMKVVQWKFLKGKPRYPLLKLLQSNSDSSVEDCTRKGLAEASKKGHHHDQEALSEICRLRGVGPATASAILSFFRPDSFAFMDDEVIECLYEGKRGYTATIYRQINERCKQIANEQQRNGWTPRKVGMALWTAARLNASGVVLQVTTETTGSKRNATTQSQTKPKRRKTATTTTTTTTSTTKKSKKS